MFRVHLDIVPFKYRANKNRPVLIVHGLTDCSSSYLNKKVFTWYLINRGFDVWFGNSRGSCFVNNKINENLGERDLYDYSFTEMGQYDVPAFFNKVLSHYPEKSRKTQKIIYFGHSQGTSQMFVALSDPKTKEFIRAHTEIFFALSPIAYLTKISHSILLWASDKESALDFASKVMHVWGGGLDCNITVPLWRYMSYWMKKEIKFMCDSTDHSIRFFTRRMA